MVGAVGVAMAHWDAREHDHMMDKPGVLLDDAAVSPWVLNTDEVSMDRDFCDLGWLFGYTCGPHVMLM